MQVVQVEVVLLVEDNSQLEDKIMKKIRIATRGSKLALWQAYYIGGLIKRKYSDIEVEYKIIKTSGDKILDVPLAKIGGKGLFVKEIEEALLRGEADIAVHSMKDVPSLLPEGLEVGIIPKREEPFDAFLSEKYPDLKSLPDGAVVGTSSLRRQAQLKKNRPDIHIKMLRGNLDTRVRKLKQGLYDAIIVAVAGLKRLNISSRYVEVMAPPLFFPAVGQGALGIEYKKDHNELLDIISFLDHFETKVCVMAERGFLDKLEGGCQVPIGAYAELKDNMVYIRGFISDLDGKKFIYGEKIGHSSDASKVGKELGRYLLNSGGEEILREIYDQGA